MWSTASRWGLSVAVSFAPLAACGGTDNVNGLFGPGAAGGSTSNGVTPPCAAGDCAPVDAAMGSQGGASNNTGAGGSTGNAGAGSAGSNAIGGSGAGNGGAQNDASTRDVGASGAPAIDAPATPEACTPAGNEVCDGLDNNCDNHVDEGACPDGCVGATRNATRYMLCYGNNAQRSWLGAEDACGAHGMHLVRINDAEENHFVRQVANDHGYTGVIWLGASDRQNEGHWEWIDGTEFWSGSFRGNPVGGRYSNWDNNQPNSATGPEDCGAMWQGVESWHDGPCSNDRAYMCEQ